MAAILLTTALRLVRLILNRWTAQPLAPPYTSRQLFLGQVEIEMVVRFRLHCRVSSRLQWRRRCSRLGGQSSVKRLYECRCNTSNGIAQTAHSFFRQHLLPAQVGGLFRFRLRNGIGIAVPPSLLGGRGGRAGSRRERTRDGHKGNGRGRYCSLCELLPHASISPAYRLTARSPQALRNGYSRRHDDGLHPLHYKNK